MNHTSYVSFNEQDHGIPNFTFDNDNEHILFDH